MNMSKLVNEPSPPRVPLEIQEDIIQLLESGSKETYFAALVCRAWYPSATRRLYHAVDFSDGEEMARLAELALAHPRVRQHLSLIRIARFHRPACSARFPLSLSGLLTAVQTLCLCDLAGALDPDFLQEISFMSITRLELAEIRLPSSHRRLEQLVTALCSLKELEIEHLRADPCDSDLQPPMFTTAISARLQKTSINVHRATMVFNVFHEKLSMWGAEPMLDSSLQRQRNLYIAFMPWIAKISARQPALSLELTRDVRSNQIWSPQREGDYDASLGDVNQVLRRAGSSLKSFKIMCPGKSSLILARTAMNDRSNLHHTTHRSSGAATIRSLQQRKPDAHSFHSGLWAELAYDRERFASRTP